MWDTQFTDYNVMNTPFHRDILGEMAKACDRAGLKFGIYYSQRDWHHPDYGPERMEKYNEYMHNQIRELLTKYPNISVIFFDCEQYYPWQMWEGDKMFRIIHELRPDIVINDRCGVPGDFSTPEQRLGSFDLERDWESCMTFTGFWSWHGFQTQGDSLRGVSGAAGPLRRRQRQPADERRPDADGPDRSARSRPAAARGRLAGEERREHLRHARRAVQARRLRRLDAESEHRIRSCAEVGRRLDLPARPCRRKWSRFALGGGR